MGDTLFHLLPEIFLGEADPNHARFVLVSPNKNLLLGVAIMVGFLTFVAMDKGLRIATGGEGGHDHSHGTANETKSTAKASGTDSKAADGELKSRKSGVATDPVVLIEEKKESKEPSQSIKLSAYLNLIFGPSVLRLCTLFFGLLRQHGLYICQVPFRADGPSS